MYVKYYLSEKKFYPNARFCWNNLKQKYEVTYHFIMPSTLNKAGYTPLDYPKYSFRELFTKQEVLNG